MRSRHGIPHVGPNREPRTRTVQRTSFSHWTGWGLHNPPPWRGTRGLLEPVNEDKQAQPDHVDEVPVPRHALEAEVMVRREVAADAAHQDHRQHDRATGDVEAVESG